MPNYDALSIPEAIQLQFAMQPHIKLDPLLKMPVTIAGADISFNKHETHFFAAVVLLDYQSMELRGYALAECESHFPYKEGFLGFREVPALLRAWELLPVKPDAVVLDGQGIMHPRRTGIATHFGLLANVPALGIGKNKLHEKVAGLDSGRGSAIEIRNQKELLGYALRTKDNVLPVFVSPGHKMCVEDSLEIARHSLGKYRIPEPTRIAHEIANQYRTGALQAGYHEVNVPPNRQTRLF